MATIPAFRTWVTGEVVTAAELNANVRDGGNFFLSWPVAELRQTVAQSLANGSGIAILMDTEDIDTDNGHSTITNTSRYTPQTPGRFQFSGGVGFASNVTGGRFAYWGMNSVALNGAMAVTASVGGTFRILAATMTTFFNGSGDYLEIFGLQSSGGALNTDVGTGAIGGQSRMSVRMVGTI